MNKSTIAYVGGAASLIGAGILYKKYLVPAVIVGIVGILMLTAAIIATSNQQKNDQK